MFVAKAMAALVLAVSVTGAAHANCYGSGNFQTCYDASGNSYTVQRIGSQTIVNGYNADTGSNWSQHSTRIGNSTYTQGYDADGDSWNQTSTRIGNSVSVYGTDSNGEPYSYYGRARPIDYDD